ncbi:DUF885 domain-containing protein [Marinibactrum halimedae]|nr:DUF885 domain-containing protein [Marinibactrum halimedae]MCD9459798.1 DUF885 domain-containing protein [Marinibactrum halimedae]
MRGKKKLLSLALAAAMGLPLLSGCSLLDKSPLAEKEVVSEQERLMAYLDQINEENLERSPITSTYRGRKDGYGEWDDASEAAAIEEHKITLKRKAKLAKFDAAQMDTQGQLSLKIAQLYMDRSIAGYEFRHNDYVMQQFSAWHTWIPSLLINIHRVKTEQDLKDYLSRVEKVDDLFEQVIDNMRIQAEKGVYPPRWSYPQMLAASANVIKGAPFQGGKDNTLFADFKKKLDSLNLSEHKSVKYTEQMMKALLTSIKPAYKSLIAELEAQYEVAPEGDGVWRLPNGDDYYRYLLNYYTTTDLTADEVHQLGLENVQRIHNEMREIMKQVGFEGTLQEFFAFMREDKQFYYDNTDEGRAAYLEKSVELIDTVREVLPEYFGIFPKAELEVKRVEAFREASAGKAFYQGPPPDGSRPGIYYVNLYKMEDMPSYQMEALAYHEGIPGHHMQLAITAELEGVPEFQKFVRFTAYTEGWGLYSEYLAKEMGFYEDPYSDFGRLAMELWRACRLVVDTGIHSKKWTREEAIQYLQDNTPNPANDTVKAIERYIVYPGQATSYLIGKIKIVELREAAKKALGDKFDIRGFHDEILKDGPVALSILEDKINAWVEAQR